MSPINLALIRQIEITKHVKFNDYEYNNNNTKEQTNVI